MSKTNVSFQGEPGAFSEAAAFEYFGSSINTLPCKTFDQAFESVTQGKCSHGILPIENTLAGSIHRNFDLLLRYDLTIVAEHHLRVRHCLLGLPDALLKDVRKVFSHPAALAQCESSLDKLGVERIAENDTAGSARLIKEKGEPTFAAIASKHAAQVYGLQVLKHDMEDNPENFTRFLVLSREPSPKMSANGNGLDYKTSIVFSLDNKPGILFKALSVFALREIDLTKIESRPLIGKPWEYLFYIDFIGHTESETCKHAMRHLEEIAPFSRILGSYPRHRLDNHSKDNPG